MYATLFYNAFNCRSQVRQKLLFLPAHLFDIRLLMVIKSQQVKDPVDHIESQFF